MSLLDLARQQAAAYRGDHDRPLGGYVGAMSVFGTGVATVTLAARRRPVPAMGPWETLVLGVATHKAARLITKDAVTSALRAPFTSYCAPSGEAEVMEEVRGTGARHAIGEMVTCPFCLGPWIATALASGHVFAPRFTRMATRVLAAVALSDFLQLAYDGAQQRTEPPESRTPSAPESTT